MLTKGVVLLLDNARPHTAARTNALIKLFNWEIFYHPSYSPDLAPSDYHLFITMKGWLGTQHFHTNEELMDGVNNWLLTWRGATKISIAVRQVPKCGWQLCGEVMQLCM
jgi:transposase